jgi:hypothetical protein
MLAEEYALAGKGVDVWRPEARVADSGQTIAPPLVSGNQKDIWPIAGALSDGWISHAISTRIR